ncbi:MAG: nitrogenase [Lentisphaerae bacterium]|nr:nitrogenase [Lentisphaerota bacterium]
MLKCVNKNIDVENFALPIAETEFPQPFTAELEFNAPARGMWNIVHTGMLIPQSHQIFVCAQGCLRGVILTAAEMNAMDRMSFVTVEESDLFNGRLESNVIEGTSAILSEMPLKSRAVLLFLSCVQLFAGCDMSVIYRELRERFPEVDFIECLMHPTMRKSGLTPDAFMRKQLYAPLKENTPVRENCVNIIGNDRVTAASSELIQILKTNGFCVRDIAACRDYDEYLAMAESLYNISYYPTARAGNEFLCRRLQRKFLHLPLSYSFEEIAENYKILGSSLNVNIDTTEFRKSAEKALHDARNVIGDMPVVIDYTATLRNLSLARLLLENGFNVKRIYTDVMIPEEKADFEFLQKKYPELMIYPTLHPAMRFAIKTPGTGDEFLAIGQKAACFTGTRHLVNIVSGGGWYGFDGITQMCKALITARNTLSDTEKLIQLKGWGCESCL